MISSRVLSALHWIGSVIRLCFHLHALSRKAVGGIQHRSGLREWGMVGMNRHSNRHTPRRKCKMRSKFWWLTDFAIRMTYRISLRSSSVWEPRHPLLKVFWHYFFVWKSFVSTTVRSFNPCTVVLGRRRSLMIICLRFVYLCYETQKLRQNNISRVSPLLVSAPTSEANRGEGLKFRW